MEKNDLPNRVESSEIVLQADCASSVCKCVKDTRSLQPPSFHQGQ